MKKPMNQGLTRRGGGGAARQDFDRQLQPVHTSAGTYFGSINKNRDAGSFRPMSAQQARTVFGDPAVRRAIDSNWRTKNAQMPLSKTKK